MKIRYVLYTFTLIAMSVQTINAGTPFIPWDADVSIADENIPVAIIRNIKTDIPARHRSRETQTVYNGPQGGAYFLIRFFQVVISPQDGPHCRFSPTCSAYGRHAVERFGSLLGPMLAGDRLIRCNPFSPPGADPVPEKLLSR